MMTVLIRSMKDDDVSILAAIIGKNYNKHCAEAFHHEARCAFYHYPFKPRFLVAENFSKIVGCVCWNTDWVSWGVFNISWVQVDPEYKGQGIGKMLVDAALTELRPIASMVLLATTKPAYYERWGFQPLKSYRATVEYEVSGETEILMGLTIATQE
jgi:predicted N-acetyltransferase YhbS